MRWLTGNLHTERHEQSCTCSSIQSNNASMYRGAVSLMGFFTLTPSAQRYSYCMSSDNEDTNQIDSQPGGQRRTGCCAQAPCMEVPPV